MAAEWQEVTIGDLCDAGATVVQTGPFGSQLHADEYLPQGVPVVPTEAIRNRQIDWSVLPRISKEKAKTLSRHLLQVGDILFARRGIQATGHIGYIRQAEQGMVCGTGAILLRVKKPRELDSEFLSHVLADPRSIELFKFHAVGATMPNLNDGIIRSFRFLLPQIEEQRRIAAMLSALDDRIELSRKSCGTLEELARAIFKSWFVEFDPVRAKAEGREPEGMDADTAALFASTFEDSELGPIPQGWTTGPITNVLSLNPTRSLKKKVTATYLDMASVPTSGPRATSWIKRDFASGSKFINGDTLLARITPCLENGKTAYVDFLEQDEVGWGSTEFIAMATKPNVPSQFAYLLARDPEFRQYAIQSMSGTSGRQRVQVDQLAMFKIAIANDSIYRAFGTLVEPLFQRIKYSSEEQTTLADLRDTLLPRLISGKLRVPEAEAMLTAV